MSARRRTALRGGYTMVEVMMGLSILAIGSVSIMGLQKFAAMGTLTSRHITSASAVSAGVLEAMNAESLSWVDNTPTSGEVDRMPWLGSALVAANGTNQGLWARPTTIAPLPPDVAGTFNAFTLEGVAQDADSVGAPTAYCTHVRATWLGRQNELGPGTADDAGAVRVDVRTFWARSGRDISNECDANGVFSILAVTDLLESTVPNNQVVNRFRDEYGVVYFTTIIRRPSA